MKSLIGKNALTVFLSNSKDDGLKMFFCPYTRNNVAQYTGDVEMISPGYDSVIRPTVIIRPQKLSENINYIFNNTNDKPQEYVSFWIQYRTFDVEHVHTYHCHNCQAPQLYFNKDKAVHFDNKTDIKNGEEYVCSNPFCRKKLKFMGIVSVSLPDIM